MSDVMRSPLRPETRLTRRSTTAQAAPGAHSPYLSGQPRRSRGCVQVLAGRVTAGGRRRPAFRRSCSRRGRTERGESVDRPRACTQRSAPAPALPAVRATRAQSGCRFSSTVPARPDLPRPTGLDRATLTHTERLVNGTDARWRGGRRRSACEMRRISTEGAMCRALRGRVAFEAPLCLCRGEGLLDEDFCRSA